MSENKLSKESFQTLFCKQCRNFYANPEWNSMCWQCFRTHSKQDSIISTKKWFHWFNKPNYEKQTINRNHFRELINQSGMPFLTSRLTNELSTALYDFTKSVIAQSDVRAMTDLFSRLYRIVSELYCARVKDPDSDQCKVLVEWVEKTVVHLLHKYIYCPVEDEHLDLELQHKISRLWWLQGRHVGCMLPFEDTNVAKSLQMATDILIGLSLERSTIDKLQAITECCTHVLDSLIYKGTNHPINADDFIPALIYVVVHSNAPQLISNTRFISRFSAPHRLQVGKMAYYFTNMCSVIHFISNVSQSSLVISQGEYEEYMSPSRDTAEQIIHSLRERMQVLTHQTGRLCTDIDILSSSFTDFSK